MKIDSNWEGAAPQVICLGGAALDRKYRALAPLQAATSNPARADTHFGGVARNVCENLARLGVRTALHTLVGEDAPGRALMAELADLGVDSSGVRAVPQARTAEYAAVLEPDGALGLGLADMAIFDHFGQDDAAAVLDRPACWIFADCNLSEATLRSVIEGCRLQARRLAVDAVSALKASRLPQRLQGVDLMFLNAQEAAALLGRDLPPIDAAAAIRARGVARVALTLGGAGGLVADADGVWPYAAREARAKDATGAGDALIAAMLWRLLRGDSLIEAARIGAHAAALTLESGLSVRPDLARALEATEGRRDAAMA